MNLWILIEEDLNFYTPKNQSPQWLEKFYVGSKSCPIQCLQTHQNFSSLQLKTNSLSKDVIV